MLSTFADYQHATTHMRTHLDTHTYALTSSLLSIPQHLQQPRFAVASLNGSVCADLLTSALILICRALWLSAPIYKPISCACVWVCRPIGKAGAVKFLICTMLWGCEEFQLSLTAWDGKRCGCKDGRLCDMADLLGGTVWEAACLPHAVWCCLDFRHKDFSLNADS